MSKAAISTLLATAVLGVAACREQPTADGPPLVLTVGSEVTVRGVVTGIDLEAMAVDGDGLIRLREPSGRELTLVLPAGERPCMAEGMSLISRLKPGEKVEAVGRVRSGGEIFICNEGHALRRVSDPG